MGSGKSSIGKLLAKTINYNFYDLDKIIEQKNNCKISEIFEKHGEDYFRQLETSVLSKYIDANDAVISTGGGCVIKECNHHVLKQGLVVYLKISVEAQYDRIKNRTHRPLFKNSDSISVLKIINEKRNPIYEKLSDIIIDVSELDKEDIISEITMRIKKL